MTEKPVEEIQIEETELKGVSYEPSKLGVRAPQAVLAFFAVVLLLDIWAIVSTYAITHGTMGYDLDSSYVNTMWTTIILVPTIIYLAFRFARKHLGTVYTFTETYIEKTTMLSSERVMIEDLVSVKLLESTSKWLKVVPVPSRRCMLVITIDQTLKWETLWSDHRTALYAQIDTLSERLGDRSLEYQEQDYWATVWRRMKKNQTGILGFYIVVGIFVMASFAMILSLIDPIDLQDPTTAFLPSPSYIDRRSTPPSMVHPFGTDFSGRDVLARCIFGAPLSLGVGLASEIVVMTLGISLGAISGYFGGIVDEIIMRVVELLMAMPGFFLFVILVSSFREVAVNVPGGIYMVVLVAFSLVGWGGIARIMRSQVLSLKQQEFVLSARALGATDARIVRKHIIPNAVPSMIVIFTMNIAGTIGSIATLAFLGLGDPSLISWGDDIAKASFSEYWAVLGPGFPLFLTILGFNLVGDAVRDALDPRLKQ